MKSATTASTEMPSPAMAIPVCPVATNAAFSPIRRSAATISSDAVILPTAASEPTVKTTVAPTRGRGADEQHVRATRDRIIDRGDDRHATTHTDVVRGIGAGLRRIHDRH